MADNLTIKDGGALTKTLATKELAAVHYPVHMWAKADGTDATAALLAVLAGHSGCVASASFTPAAAAYVANDIMDVAKQFTFTYADGSTIPSGSKIRILDIILRIDQTALQGTEGVYVLQPYTVTPPSAQADNAAWTLASGDLSAYCGPGITIGTPVDLGSACYVKAPNIDVDISLASSSLWMELQTLASFTATAVARQVTIIAVVL